MSDVVYVLGLISNVVDIKFNVATGKPDVVSKKRNVADYKIHVAEVRYDSVRSQ